MALQWYREHGTLPTQSGLIKGKVLDHCLSTERALTPPPRGGAAHHQFNIDAWWRRYGVVRN